MATPVAGVGYDVEAARADLPALAEYTYLNVGTEGLVAEPVLAEYLAATAAHDRYGHVGIARAAEETETARARLAALLHCDVDELAFTHNATDGTTLFAASVRWRAGGEIIISNEEHPAIIQPWYALAQTGGIRVRQFAVSPDADETLANFAAVLTEHTVAIAVSCVSCETGIRLPITDMCHLARERGAWAFVDCAQAAGQFDFSPRDLGADVVASNGHKWLCGPKGTGFVWVAAERLPELTPRFGAGTYALGPLREAYTDGATPRLTPLPSARRFEYGTRNFAPYAGLDAALRYRDALGPAAIESHQAALSTQLKRDLAAIPGVVVHTPLAWERSCGLVTFSVAGWRGTDLSKVLWDEYRIIQRRVEMPSGVRVSVAHFTNDADCARLCEVVEHLRQHSLAPARVDARHGRPAPRRGGHLTDAHAGGGGLDGRGISRLVGFEREYLSMSAFGICHTGIRHAPCIVLLGGSNGGNRATCAIRAHRKRGACGIARRCVPGSGPRRPNGARWARRRRPTHVHQPPESGAACSRAVWPTDSAR